jgi:hypothetical protein
VVASAIQEVNLSLENRIGVKERTLSGMYQNFLQAYEYIRR